MRFNLTGEGLEAYEAWAAEIERVGLWAAPFEPRQEDPEGGEGEPSRMRHRGPVTQVVARPNVNAPREPSGHAAHSPGVPDRAVEGNADQKKRRRRRRKRNQNAAG